MWNSKFRRRRPQDVELRADGVAVVGPDGGRPAPAAGRPAPAAGHPAFVEAVRPLLLFGADST